MFTEWERHQSKPVLPRPGLWAETNIGSLGTVEHLSVQVTSTKFSTEAHARIFLDAIRFFDIENVCSADLDGRSRP